MSAASCCSRKVCAGDEPGLARAVAAIDWRANSRSACTEVRLSPRRPLAVAQRAPQVELPRHQADDAGERRAGVRHLEAAGAAMLSFGRRAALASAQCSVACSTVVAATRRSGLRCSASATSVSSCASPNVGEPFVLHLTRHRRGCPPGRGDVGVAERLLRASLLVAAATATRSRRRAAQRRWQRSRRAAPIHDVRASHRQCSFRISQSSLADTRMKTLRMMWTIPP